MVCDGCLRFKIFLWREGGGVESLLKDIFLGGTWQEACSKKDFVPFSAQ
jgi:hypothetical protein